MSEHIAFIAETADYDDIDILVDTFHHCTVEILVKICELREIIIPTFDEDTLIDEYLSLITLLILKVLLILRV